MPVNPWRDLRAWQERLERLSSHHADSWTPPIDVYETADRYVVAAELPGLAREQIELAMADSRLTIRGQRVERPVGRRRPLPPGRARARRVLAHLRVHRQDRRRAGHRPTSTDGVLTVTLPKVPPPPARKIEVR